MRRSSVIILSRITATNTERFTPLLAPRFFSSPSHSRARLRSTVYHRSQYFLRAYLRRPTRTVFVAVISPLLLAMVRAWSRDRVHMSNLLTRIVY
jgi:hypothetical protein